MTTDILPTMRAILSDVTEMENPHALGPDDDLFAHGLTSLETLRVLLQIEERFQVRIPDDVLGQELFRSLHLLEQTVAGLRTTTGRTMTEAATRLRQPFAPGTVLNPLPRQAPVTPVAQQVEVTYPLRVNAMALDPSLVTPSPDHRYTAGEVVISIATSRSVVLTRRGADGDIDVLPGSDRPPVVRHAVGIMRAALGVADGVEVYAAPLPFQRHSGLGSTSSLIAAVAAAMNELYGRPVGALDMIRYLAQNHGEESADSELLVPVQCLGGSAASGHLPAAVTVLADQAVPIGTSRLDGVQILLGTPKHFADRDAGALLADEVRHMDGFVSTGLRYAPQIAYRLVHQCLPALAGSDVRPLGALVFDYRFDMGSIRNCSFALPGLSELADRLRDLRRSSNLLFLGISSVGPTFFAIGEDLAGCRRAFEQEGMAVHLTEPCNDSYRVTVSLT